MLRRRCQGRAQKLPPRQLRGLDGLNAQHVLDLLSVGSEVCRLLIESLVRVSDLVSRGRLPEPARDILYGPWLVAASKKYSTHCHRQHAQEAHSRDSSARISLSGDARTQPVSRFPREGWGSRFPPLWRSQHSQRSAMPFCLRYVTHSANRRRPWLSWRPRLRVSLPSAAVCRPWRIVIGSQCRRTLHPTPRFLLHVSSQAPIWTPWHPRMLHSLGPCGGCRPSR